MSASYSIKQLDDTCHFTGVLDFTTARPVLQELGQHVRDTDRLTIDFSGAGPCNSAALAVLIELRAIARRQGHEVGFSGVPEGIRQLAKVCEVSAWV